MTISANEFNKIQETITRAQNILNEDLPRAQFVLIDVNAERVFFRVALEDFTAQEIKDLKEKTPFGIVSEQELGQYYFGEFEIYC